MSDNYQPIADEPNDEEFPLHKSKSTLEKLIENKKEKHELQKIDFKKQLENYRERTEGSRPYTIQQIEDVMFIDNKKLVALEYIFYQRNIGENGKSDYQTARIHHENVIDDDDHMLGAEEYKENIDETTNQTNAFTNEPIIYDTKPDRQKDFLDEFNGKHMYHKNEDGSDVYQVEAIISLWNISKTGTLMKYIEQAIDYPQTTYQDCNMDHMRLNLSDDRKYISLSCTDINDHSSDIHFKAWKVKDLKPLILNKKLIQNLNAPVHGSIRSIRFVGNSFYVLKEFVDNNVEQTIKLQHRFAVWQLFDVNTGKKVFESNNKFVSSQAPEDVPPLNDPDLRLIGLIPKPKDLPEEEKEDDESDWEFKERSFNRIPTKAAENDEEQADDDDEIDPKTLQDTLDLVFVYAKDAIKKKEQTKKTKSSKKKKDDKNNKDDKWIMTFQNMSLKAILKESKSQDIKTSEYVENEVNESLKDFKSAKEQQNSFTIPKAWFSNKAVNWEHQIIATANQKFDQFAILNLQKKIYLAFDNTDQSNFEEFKKYPIAQSAVVTLARNQTLKEHLFIVYRQGNDTFTQMFINKQEPKKISFKDDHSSAWQDVQICHGKEDSSDKVFLQSCTISAGDQEILLQTQIERKNDEEGNKEETVNRKSISQYHSGVFPVLCYNVGLNKIIAHNTLQDGKQYVIEIQKDETFVNFIDFIKLEDIGFYPGKLRMEACSRIAFITLDQKDKYCPVYRMNFLLVDPYYEDPQIVLFRSDKVFEMADTVGSRGTPINLDTCVKMFVYNTKENDDDYQFDVKMITQYPNHFIQDTLVEPEATEQEEGEAGEDESEYGSEDYSESEYSDESGNESDEEDRPTQIASIPMIQDEQGHIYFIIIFDGQCIIKEINPTEDVTHTSIYELQSEGVLGFSYNKGYFYLMDNTKKVNQLIRQQESIQLIENDVFTIKDKDLNKFLVQPGIFVDMIMSDKYIIQGSKIFYLNNDIPFASGVLDMEDLKENKWNYVQGPYKSKGCNEFTVVYKNANQKQFKSIIYQLPDSVTTNLIGDYENKVTMSTFLDDGDILLQVGYRFMLFENNGEFKDEIEFSDVAEEDKKDQEKLKITKELSQKIVGINSSLIQQQSSINQDPDDHENDEEQEDKKKKDPNQNEKDTYDKYRRMELIKMSNNNKYFMFYDNKSKFNKIYEIKKVEGSNEYQFVLEYVLDHEQFEAKKLFEQTKVDKLDEDGKHVIGEDGYKELASIETIEDLKRQMLDHTVNVKVEDDGDVRFTFNNHQKDNPLDVNINIYAGEFKKNGQTSDYRDFKTNIESFDASAKVHALQLLKQKKKEFEYQIDVEEQQQNLLAPVLRNKKKLKNLNKLLTIIDEKMKNSVFSQIFDKDLLVVQCGRYIQYTAIDEKLWDNDRKLDFTPAKIEFDKDVVIEKIQSTCKKHHLQIVARDNLKKVLIILTWNFDENIEYSMLQFNIELDSRPENYVVRGLDQKVNYFVNQHQIYDLEYNIPMQASGYNSMHGNGVGSLIPNQRKIYKDSTISLCVDHGSILNNPVCRIDLIFWLNITDLGEKIEDISENTSLEQFNTIYGGLSLIHHFADNVDVIEMLHDKFLTAKADKVLTPEQEYMPLVCLYPSNGEKQGETALDVALSENRPHSFELMVDMLEDFDNFCLSKMMLTSFPNMIQMNTKVIKKFFDSGVYKPPLMHFQHSIPWPEDTESFVFPCYTSLMSKNLLTKELIGAGLVEEDDVKDRNKVKEEVKQEKQKKKQEQAKKKLGTKKEQDLLDEENFEWLRSQLLPSEVAKEIDTDEQRVDVEAIDFDWIFVGDAEKKTSNAKNLLLLLNSQEDGELFIQKSIKIFIELVWEKYQKVIIREVFLPYMLYLAFFIYLASSVAGTYLESIEDARKKDPTKRYYDILPLAFCQAITFIVCYFLFKFSFQMEIQQFIKEPLGYLGDVWNWLDLGSFVFNTVFLVCINIDVAMGSIVIPIGVVRVIGAFACFLMWIKVFYWMRLFSGTAYFIKLILSTLKDSVSFALMLIIIICAFANLFFIIQLNVKDGADYHYVVDYTGEPVTSAWIAMYVLAMGDFHFSGYGQGYDIIIAWLFFILGTYLLLLVFMNVLIAIMGDTFGRVSSLQEQSALQEQVSLMNDFIDYVNIAEEFKNMRYIIRVSPIGGEQEISTDMQELFTEHGKTVSKKGESHHQILAKRMDLFEKNTRAILKSATSKISAIKKDLTETLKKKNQSAEGQVDAEEDAVGSENNVSGNKPEVNQDDY